MPEKNVAKHFAGRFQHIYAGIQADDAARADFCRLTNNYIMWAQVHGDFKDHAKAALFTPYPHWRELHECCGMAIAQRSKDKYEYFHGDITCAKIMSDAMKILRMKYGHNAPKWWLPMINQLKSRPEPKEKTSWR